jgi:hypothetical protein
VVYEEVDIHASAAFYIQQGAEKGFLPLPHGHGSQKRALIPKQLLSRAREQTNAAEAACTLAAAHLFR